MEETDQYSWRLLSPFSWFGHEGKCMDRYKSSEVKRTVKHRSEAKPLFYPI